MEFLSFAEVAEVDKALLTSQDKFLARVALYSLRSLKQITQITGQSPEDITPQQVMTWVEQDENVSQQAQGDDTFLLFFTQLVMSSLQPLKLVAEAEGCAIADLEIPQVITWFEQRAKARMAAQQS
ncbi:MAG: hypothetical protein MUF49_04510 [Oculatellaceae cyanobacterium Prado106]|jgi:hypothetical protein|nr:hypothetical protein [Oculatellaceae cyanobacterium Prado106]